MFNYLVSLFINMVVTLQDCRINCLINKKVYKNDDIQSLRKLLYIVAFFFVTKKVDTPFAIAKNLKYMFYLILMWTEQDLKKADAATISRLQHLSVLKKIMVLFKNVVLKK